MTIGKFQIVSNTIGHIVAYDVSEEVYLKSYARFYHEWVNGTVVKFPAIDNRHNAIARYLGLMLSAYFRLRPVGYALRAPFVMRLEQLRACFEPDIQILFTRNKHRLSESLITGPADIAIEVVGEESQSRDYAEKLYAYERGGVAEYWIIDPLRKECRFYVANKKQAYVLQEVDNVYATPLLPGFNLHVPTLWEDPLPGAVGDMVRDMLQIPKEEATVNAKPPTQERK
jgi:Uma2 family endonuclease